MGSEKAAAQDVGADKRDLTQFDPAPSPAWPSCFLGSLPHTVLRSIVCRGRTALTVQRWHRRRTTTRYALGRSRLAD